MNTSELPKGQTNQRQSWFLFVIGFVLVVAALGIVVGDEEDWLRAFLLHLFKALFRSIR